MKARMIMPMSVEMKKIADRIKAEIEHDVKEDQNKAINRTIKMSCIVLNNVFSFGNKRLVKYLEEMHKCCDDVVVNPEQWYYIDEYLEKLGLCFEKEDTDEREQHSKEVYHEKGRKFRDYK